ncbi:hypothetical protein [Streptomyces sp. NPDC059861]|uniref:hypothetical protein n=1 Tax=Streptomyces sp. NPDC059861 TaxID=3346974 RepID=UPI00364992B2
MRSMNSFRGEKPGVNRSGYFAECNSRKRSICLDLQTGRGRTLAFDLIAPAAWWSTTSRRGPWPASAAAMSNLARFSTDAAARTVTTTSATEATVRPGSRLQPVAQLRIPPQTSSKEPSRPWGDSGQWASPAS